ncbi:WD repeat-containing protein 90, partial [Durusdinium trenchii]
AVWQKPFVDVFKVLEFSSGSWGKTHRVGSVRRVLDKEIGKNVLQVAGTTSTSNYVRVPGKQGSLGLTGALLYLQLKPVLPKLFTIHIEVLGQDNFVTRLTLSNMFRVFKRKGNVIQVPLDLGDNWHTVALDVQALLTKCRDQVHSDVFWCVKAIKFCSSVLVRGVFTSETVFSANGSHGASWPKAMDLHRGVARQSADSETLLWLPAVPSGDLIRKGADRVPRGCLAAGSGGALSANATSSACVRKAAKSKSADVPAIESPSPRLEQEDQENHAANAANPKVEDRRATKGTLKAKSGDAKPRNRLLQLKPDPIMKLHTYVGFSCQVDKAKPLWSRDGGKIVFASANNIVVADASNVKAQQRILFGHTSAISSLAVDQEGTVLASAQCGKNPVIRLWELCSGKCVGVIAACEGGSLRSLDFSSDGAFLCAVGKDQHNRTQVLVWDVTKVLQGRSTTNLGSGLHSQSLGSLTSAVSSISAAVTTVPSEDKVSLVAKQTSEFDISRIRFAPYDPCQLVSGGRENIRFWRVRNRHLPGMPVVLNEFARNADYADVAFESSFGESLASSASPAFDKRVFVASSVGTVVSVHYERRTVLCVYRLHDGPIHSLTVNEGFCVTASEDQYVRVWPLDFSDFFLEAKHESPAASVDVSPDGLQIVIGTTGGSLGVLSVANHTHVTKLRAHSGAINAVCFHLGPNGENEMATAASDGTVRVWSVPSCEEMYDFLSPGDSATSCAYLPGATTSPRTLICGYRSGFFRVFNVPEAKLVFEYKQHPGAIHAVAVSLEGSRSFSLGAEGLLCVYDNTESFQPVKMTSLTLPGAAGVEQRKARSGHKADQGPKTSASAPHRLAMSPRGDLLAVVARDADEVVLFNPDSALDVFVPILRVRRPTRAFATVARFSSAVFRSDGSELLCCTNDNRICKFRILHSAQAGWEATLVRDSHSFHPEAISALALSPKRSAFMVTSGSDHLVQVWDSKMRSASPSIQRFLAHGSAVNDVGFSLDGRFVCSVGAEQTMVLWDFEGDDDMMLGQDDDGAHPATASAAAAPEIIGSSRVRDVEVIEEAAMREAESGGLEVVGRQIQPRATREIDPSTLPFKHCLLPRWQSPPEACRSKAVADVSRVSGFNTHSCSCMRWHPSSGLFFYSSGKLVVVEDLGTREQACFTSHASTVSALAVSLSGKWVASGSGTLEDGAEGDAEVCSSAPIVIWEVTAARSGAWSLKVHKRMVGHLRGGVQQMCFSPDGSQLVSVGSFEDGMLSVWDLVHGTLLHSEMLLDGLAHDVVWNEATTIVTAGTSGQLSVWTVGSNELDLTTLEQQVVTLGRHGQGQEGGVDLTSLAEAPKWLVKAHGASSVVAVGDARGQMSVVALPELAVLAQWQATDNEVANLAWCDRTLVCGVSSGVVVVWDVAETYPAAGSIPAQVFNCGSPVIDMSWQAQGSDGIVATADGAMWYLNAAAEDMVAIVRSHPDRISQMSVSRNEALAITCTAEESIVRIWDTTNFDLVATVHCNAGTGGVADGVVPRTTAVAFWEFFGGPRAGDASPDTCVLGLADGSIQVIRAETSALVCSVQAFAGGEACCTLACVGPWLFCGGADGAVVAFQALDRQGMLDESSRKQVAPAQPFGSAAVQLVASPSMPELVAVVQPEGSLVLVECVGDEINEIFAIEGQDIHHASFSACHSGDVLWCLAPHTAMQVKIGEAPAVERRVSVGDVVLTAASADFFGSDHGTVLTSAAGKPKVVYDGHVGAVHSLCFLGNSRTLLSAAGHQVVAHKMATR